ncbi:hypothetical protein G6F63_014720 [Rhizopus arrhizus]|uniref:Uncharacterized protein n=1 Tax=Rhizopus oryzae TaxID=64495 RepID=A0A9P7BKF7_RHIOR|nr:hypothetical protein G6F21_013255 [Rhizopus arrhizus]KAG0804155.1 hypothetical protein G6F19_014195 [Rhizopus arrhizus]KAG0807380.1 hypothetical protein G6F18_013922 [Rhizopus arrhizus]KAG0848167.1 hypothetical protein G6F15_014271 [Rhizopus arrhizus]KAG0881490.1 hypothetical protein G6F34_013686 [Rhizopus arrhizus]
MAVITRNNRPTRTSRASISSVSSLSSVVSEVTSSRPVSPVAPGLDNFSDRPGSPSYTGCLWILHETISDFDCLYLTRKGIYSSII